MASRTGKTLSNSSSLVVNGEMKKSKKRVNRPYNTPKKWTLVVAFDIVFTGLKQIGLNDQFWKDYDEPLTYLSERLVISKLQCVFVAAMLNEGEPMSWHYLADALGVSRLSVMVYSDDLEDLVYNGWVQRQLDRFDSSSEQFSLQDGVMKSILQDEAFVPESLECETLQELIEKLVIRIAKGLKD